MQTLVSDKWMFSGILEGSLCFDSTKFSELRMLCGKSCKLVDSQSGNVAILQVSGGNGLGVEAQWTHATKRKAKEGNFELPNPSSILGRE